MRKFLLLLTLISVSTVLAGCETISGVGKDLEKAGSAITDAAN